MLANDSSYYDSKKSFIPFQVAIWWGGKLLTKDKGNGPPPALDAKQMAAFKAELEKGNWYTGGQAYAWLQKGA